MRKAPALIALRGAMLLAPCLTAACAGGGGGSDPPPVLATTSTTVPATTSTAASDASTYCCSNLGPTSLGSVGSTHLAAGPIGAPPAATFGTVSAQTAVAGGPTMDGKTGSYPTNVTFPLISTGLMAVSPGLGALAPSPRATATLTNSPSGYTLQLVIPGANINAALSGQVGVVAALPGDDPTWGYSYVVLGEWSSPANGNALQSQAVFAFGYETPASAMPSSGTASFTGYADAMVYKSVGGNILDTYLTGNAAITANFGSGKVSGALTQMLQWDGYSWGGSNHIPINYLPWNDVSVNANIVGGTNRFSGSTAATSAPGTAFSLSSSATGHIDGAFFGPAAQNLGAVWSLSDGTISAFGTVGAKQ